MIIFERHLCDGTAEREGGARDCGRGSARRWGRQNIGARLKLKLNALHPAGQRQGHRTNEWCIRPEIQFRTRISSCGSCRLLIAQLGWRREGGDWRGRRQRLQSNRLHRVFISLGARSHTHTRPHTRPHTHTKQLSRMQKLELVLRVAATIWMHFNYVLEMFTNLRNIFAIV